MAGAKIGDLVRVHYTCKLEDGTVCDTALNSEPLQFVIGEGEVIPGFEEAVIGMKPNESKTVKIPVDKAYGPHREDLVLVVDREQLPADVKPEIGHELEGLLEDGQTIFAKIIKVDESSVTLDVNHPLAGKDLIFDIQLIEIL
jgi:peptidylprolyl isomerase